jgi:hypothetical protein
MTAARMRTPVGGHFDVSGGRITYGGGEMQDGAEEALAGVRVTFGCYR